MADIDLTREEMRELGRILPEERSQPEKVVQILPVSRGADVYFLYITAEGTVWRTLDPESDKWEKMPVPTIAKQTTDLLKPKLNHGKRTKK